MVPVPELDTATFYFRNDFLGFVQIPGKYIPWRKYLGLEDISGLFLELISWENIPGYPAT